MPPFSASSVEFDITPPVGGFMEGYAAREGVSQGVHDPLLGQVLLLHAGGKSILMVTLDLLGVPLRFAHQVRAAIHADTGIPVEHILLSCSHTHSGPAGILTEVPGLRAEPDPALQEIILRKIVGAARQAQRSLQPAAWGSSRGQVEGVGANRNNPLEGPQDEEVLALRVDDASGRPLAILMNYGCHPTIMGHNNLLISADFPGATRRALKAIYPSTAIMFTNGASGDISTRFTRRGQDFNEVERSGRILAGEVLKVVQTIETSPAQHVGGSILPIHLPFRSLPLEADAAREIQDRETDLRKLEAAGAPHGEIRKALTRLQGAQAQALLRTALAGKTGVHTELQVLFMDGYAWLGIPGEPFTRIVQSIKQNSPFEQTAVVSYANDEAGYFPDDASFKQGTYEALISPYQQDVAARITEQAAQLLESFHHV
ncbi:MAG: neutral/alkaline non-lysosomal ceramidase N-terminal domain-containing protein [Anaerolineales bacterium]|nr:neutral/alkaline non-lysosomal ceramidase N-terminal domain-containing protein [Anaerolineales bacterium]